LAYGLESCQCMPKPGEAKTKACELCCKKPGENQPCLSSLEWNDKPYDIPDLFAKPGSPCNDYNGYCDVFQNCREVDPSGPLATLRKLLLSDEGIESFKKWVVSNWYAVSLIIVGVFALLVSFNLNVKCVIFIPNEFSCFNSPRLDSDYYDYCYGELQFSFDASSNFGTMKKRRRQRFVSCK
jgi:hypothetical protein